MNTIFKIGILVATMLTSLLCHAESKSDKIYNMFSGKEGVTYISFSKSVIKPFEIFLDDDSKKVIYKMEKVRFINYSQKEGELKSTEVSCRILKTLESTEYFPVNPNEFNIQNSNNDWDGEDVKMFGRGEKKNMNELHIIINENDNCTLFSFYGNISVEDIKYCSRFSKSTKINVSR